MIPTSFAVRSIILKEGLNAGWPICLGYLPIGMAFGVLAQKAGLTPLQIGLMSIMVFAGSAQFIAVAMLAGGASAPAIITTTFVVNLRHVLMSSALAVYLRAAHRGLLALYAYGVTDESFAVNLPRFNAGNWSLSRALVVNHAANLTWFISTQRFAVASPDPRRGPQTSRPSAAGVVGGTADVRFCLVDAIIGWHGGSGDGAILVGGKGESDVVCWVVMKKKR